MAVPQYDQLLNPTLKALAALNGSGSIEEINDQVIRDLQPAPAVLQVLHKDTGQTELEYRLAWARTYLKKFGLIMNSERGVWALTTKGHDVGSVDPREVVRSVQLGHRQRPKGAARAPESPTQDSLPIESASDETASWRERLLDLLQKMPPAGFERLCQRLLRESGFIEVEVTGRSGDGGIDGHGIIRVAGLISFPVLFQCKRYQGNVGPGVVRDFRGAMVGRADKGLIITTAGFTREARAEATRDGAPPIDLIGSDLLIEKLKELRLGLRTRMVEVVEIDETWYQTL